MEVEREGRGSSSWEERCVWYNDMHSGHHFGMEDELKKRKEKIKSDIKRD